MNIFNEGIRNNFLLKVLNRLDFFQEEGNKSIRHFASQYKKYGVVSSFMSTAPSLIGILVVAFLTHYLSGELSGLAMISFIYVFIRFSQAAGESVRALNSIHLYLPSVDRMLDFFKKIDAIPDTFSRSDKSLTGVEDISIEAVDMCFSYGNSSVISQLSFKVSKGEIFLIKGESGSGKSTLLKLLLGFISPKSGHIKYGNEIGVPCDLDQFIGYVGPDPFLIPASLRDNLLYGNLSSVTDAELLDVLEIFKLPFATLADLDMVLDEDSKFSTGQRQRLSICRALLRKPCILILDEATANLDKMNIEIVVDYISRNRNRFITILTSHQDYFDDIATVNLLMDKNEG
jgi:ABC-type bacteriocin/lantibiotic exporter with double-glycine peptidase domain